MNRKIAHFAALMAGLLVAGCAPAGSDLPPLPEAQSVSQSYVLGPGDKIAITVFGVEDMKGEFTVSADGNVGVPVIGEVKAAGLDVAALERDIAGRLSDGYVKNPKVGVEVMAYRPFYILGEVNRPGTYPYAANLTVSQAVSTAGGYTYRAAEDLAVVDRNQNGKHVVGRGGPSSAILPDDTIRIPERYF